VEIREVLAELTEMLAAWHDTHGVSCVPGFNITGGEPFLRSDFFDILAEIAAGGHDQFVLSNGTLIDETSAARLAELNVAGVQVSMEGPKEVHEDIRGTGSFSAAVAESLIEVGHLLRLQESVPFTTGTAIFEGAQGVLLDEWHGFHPYTTWSTTTFANAETEGYVFWRITMLPILNLIVPVLGTAAMVHVAQTLRPPPAVR
jgi:hypothetical protein